MKRKNRNKENLEITYEDDWIIVAEKPSGLLTMSTGKSGEVTAYSMLTEYVRSTDCMTSGKHGNHTDRRLFIVHRLDRDTSGLLVFAKDHQTKLALQENWNETVLERKYIAILEGDIEDEDGWIETWNYENTKSMKVHCYPFKITDNPEKPPRKDWQYASSHCRKILTAAINENVYTMVEFELETGRKNQIRAHSQWIGHPVAGDRKYEAKTNPFGRLALHAKTLSFIHPWTGRTMRFTSKLPHIFWQLKESPGIH
ncbi:MAG: RluA family pseudouridine synthase [Bacteroidales bacterium]|nr:RluA family pseudouridine synthase [Bacteroidales bacterium]MBQ6689922.1 RluA family pseudouridine synthase [Bacteroidales bacterium]